MFGGDGKKKALHDDLIHLTRGQLLVGHHDRVQDDDLALHVHFRPENGERRIEATVG